MTRSIGSQNAHKPQPPDSRYLGRLIMIWWNSLFHQQSSSGLPRRHWLRELHSKRDKDSRATTIRRRQQHQQPSTQMPNPSHPISCFHLAQRSHYLIFHCLRYIIQLSDYLLHCLRYPNDIWIFPFARPNPPCLIFLLIYFQCLILTSFLFCFESNQVKPHQV